MNASVEVRGEKMIPLRPGAMAVRYLYELGVNAETADDAIEFCKLAAEMALELGIQQPDTLGKFISIARSTNTTRAWARAAQNAEVQVRIVYG